MIRIYEQGNLLILKSSVSVYYKELPKEEREKLIKLFKNKTIEEIYCELKEKPKVRIITDINKELSTLQPKVIYDLGKSYRKGYILCEIDGIVKYKSDFLLNYFMIGLFEEIIEKYIKEKGRERN